MSRIELRSLIPWIATGAVALLAGLLLWATGAFQVSNPRLVVAGTASASPTASPTATSTPRATETPAADAPLLLAALDLPAIEAPPGGQVYLLAPEPDAVGWVQEEGDIRNHLGDYNIYAGVYDGQQHLGAIQFDLSGLPPGAPIAYADLTLVGLSDQWLGAEGTWTAQLLQTWLDPDWQQRSFSDLAQPEGVAAELEPAFGVPDLAAGRVNRFLFDSQALAVLESRTLTGRVSFRISGPSSGTDNLFSWDSGYGTRSQGWKPLLRLAVGPTPATPPATPTPQYVVITSVPTPANVVTAAAAAATAAARATTTGTPTPMPPNWVTPIIIVPTATPANTATALWHAAVATAQALLTGIPTPLPPNVWTATPTGAAPRTPVPYVITDTPSPLTWSTAIAQAEAEATRRATAGPPTSFPPHWVTVTPIPPTFVVADTPTPLSLATVEADRARATIVALLTGTYTPVPLRYVTPTPVPLLVPVEPIPPTPLPTATPRTPLSLRGKIAFWSDRLGESRLFVMDPDGSHVMLLTQDYPYFGSLSREPVAPDGQRQAFVRPNNQGIPQIYGLDPSTQVSWAITTMSGMAYGPAWSPVAERIAFVSTTPGNDEIYAIDPDGTDLSRLTNNSWEWDKHPSWSPDGRQIVFYSNRNTGRTQIWIMNADGSGPTNISNNPYNEWDPVWLK